MDSVLGLATHTSLQAHSSLKPLTLITDQGSARLGKHPHLERGFDEWVNSVCSGKIGERSRSLCSLHTSVHYYWNFPHLLHFMCILWFYKRVVVGKGWQRNSRLGKPYNKEGFENDSPFFKGTQSSKRMCRSSEISYLKWTLLMHSLFVQVLKAALSVSSDHITE